MKLGNFDFSPSQDALFRVQIIFKNVIHDRFLFLKTKFKLYFLTVTFLKSILQVNLSNVDEFHVPLRYYSDSKMKYT